MCLFLNVPYAEKDEAKKLGAKWNPKVKKWYTDCPCEEYINFSKWILRDSDEAIIASEYIYIIEGQQTCWKCKRPTKVIGLGLSDMIHIYGEIDDPHYEESFDDELHLAWVEEENDIPPKLLHYIKEKYSAKTGYSKTLDGKCFANHCDCCGALQGNWFLFDEPGSPLSACVGGDELIERMNHLIIYHIPIDDNIQLNWNVQFCTNDQAYFRYAKSEELILSTNPDNEHISYEELVTVQNPVRRI